MINVKAILIDVGGVLVRTLDRMPRQKWEVRLGLPDQGLEKIVYGCHAAQLSTIGKASPNQVWESVQQTLNITEKDLHQLQADFWANDAVNLLLMNVLRKLHFQYQIFILSNAWQDARMTLADNFSICEGNIFEKIFISSELGLAKPDPEIFKQVSKNINIPLEDILFIDDFVENIQAADLLGMQTIHFQDANEVTHRLDSMVR